jgi:hypothetical protein
LARREIRDFRFAFGVADRLNRKRWSAFNANRGTRDGESSVGVNLKRNHRPHLGGKSCSDADSDQ